MTSQDTDQDAARGSIGDRTARGATWTAAAYAANKAVLFIASAVLAHLLTPHEFGLVAIALIVVSYVERLSEGGLEPAIVTFPGDEKQCFEHGLGVSLGLGLVFTAAGVVSAPLVGALFDEPQVTPIVAVLSVLYLTTSVRQMLSGALARRMQFSRRLIPELLRAGAKAVVMIGLALAGFGVWALTIGHLVGAIVGLAAYWIALGERIRPRISASVSRPLLRLGASFSLVSFIGTVIQSSDYAMIGIRADSSAVGLYSIGFRIPELTVLAIPSIASQSLISGFVRVAQSAGDLRKPYLNSLGLLALILTPIGLGVSLVAEDVVPLVFGGQWSGSIPVVERVGLFGVAVGLTFPLGDALKATNRAGVLVGLGLIRLVVTLPLLWIAAGRSLTAVATVHLVLAIALLATTIALAARLVGAPVGAQALALRIPLVAGAVLAGSITVLHAVLDPGPGRLAVSVIVGGFAYLGSVHLMDRSSLSRLSAFLPDRIGHG